MHRHTLIKYNSATSLGIQSSLFNKIEHKFYANLAAKHKYKENELEIYSEKEIQRILNKHLQLVTDFNLIYTNPSEIKLYSIGTLHTNYEKGSYCISKLQNYSLRDKPQHIKFYQKPIEVKTNLYIMNKSYQYFKDNEIKNKVEALSQYKQAYTCVIGELNSLGISIKKLIVKQSLNLRVFTFLQSLKG